MIDVDWFIDGGAKVMCFERPDIFTYDEARSLLWEWYTRLLEVESPAFTGTGGYMLHKWEEDGVEEYSLVRNILDFNIYPEEHTTSIFDWTRNSSVLDLGLDIPEEPVDTD